MKNEIPHKTVRFYLISSCVIIYNMSQIHTKKIIPYLAGIVFLVPVIFISLYSHHFSVLKSQNQTSLLNITDEDINEYLPNENLTTEDIKCLDEAKQMLANDLKTETAKRTQEILNNKDELMNKITFYFITCKSLKKIGAENFK